MPYRITVAHEAGGNLQIEQPCRQLTALAMAESNLLPPGMHNDCVCRVGQKLPEPLHWPNRKRVDDEKAIDRRNLNQAKLGHEGFFADELRVEAEYGASGKMIAAGGKLFGTGDEFFNRHVRTAIRTATKAQPNPNS